MDWKQAIREERAMLMRIVALLLALADLAELASRRSQAVCRLLLFIMRPAETAASTLSSCASGALPAIVSSGDARADLIQLAVRFRELARILGCWAELACECRPGDGGRLDVSSEGACILRTAAIEALEVLRPIHVPDTS